MTAKILRVLDDQAIGSIVCALRVAIGMARQEIRDAVEDGADCNETERRFDGLVEAVGITGVEQKINALDHAESHYGPGDGELRSVIDRQIGDAIRRLRDAASSRYLTAVVSRYQTPADARLPIRKS
jgi:hypothetical protein